MRWSIFWKHSMSGKLLGVRTVFFDFDGTLHESNRIYAPAFRAGYRYLVEAGKAPPKEFTDEEIAHWLGYSRAQMWNEFMGGLAKEDQKAAGRIIGQTMIELFEAGSARLYEGAAETLCQLKDKGFSLVFLSNCSRQYMENAVRFFGLERFFEAMFCAQDYDQLPKGEILRRIMAGFPREQVIVGDRYHDMEAGLENQTATVFCEYGYGTSAEGAGATFHIKRISELLELLG